MLGLFPCQTPCQTSGFLAVRGIMCGASGHLVGVPIDKNSILCFKFEDAVAYRQRLIDVFFVRASHWREHGQGGPLLSGVCA